MLMRRVLLMIVLLMCCSATAALGDAFLVRDGQPQTQIILSEHPTRTAKLAAGELQRFIERISGGKISIGTQPDAQIPTHLFVGRSKFTDELKLTDDDLKDGAFRIVSGENWLAFLGSDKDYIPAEPWPRNPNDKEEVKKVMAEWDAKSGGKWGSVGYSEHRNYSPLLDLWVTDGRGSINAVYHYLKTLGFRWYYPDETGMIIPKLTSIELPKLNIVSRPDFPMRDMLMYYQEFFTARPGTEDMADKIKWQLFLGLNSDINYLGHTQGHGTIVAISRDEMKKEHPEYYALWNGKRALDAEGYGAPCLSSPGLLQENVKMIRAMYDIANEPMFSVSPADSYHLCECDLCKGKDDPTAGSAGILSDYVWGYTDAVARELYKTHPDRKIQCISYSPYESVPKNIATFSPNVVVGMCQWRSLFYDQAERDKFRKLRRAWLEKIPSKSVFIWDYYLNGWEDRCAWVHMPTFFPHLISEDMKDLKGISMGDHIDVLTTNPKLQNDVMSVNHLNALVTAACLWNADTDVDALLNEYYEKYYGPAAKEMKTFTEYAEANWMNATKDYKVIDRFFELIEPAKKAAGDSIYGQRVARLDKYMQGMKVMRERLAKGRDGALEIRTLGGREFAAPVMDGKLDEPFWAGLEEHGLSNLITGKQPQWGTTFRTVWKDDALYVGIVCRERDNKLNITTRAPRSPAVWDGDCVEILLETPTHAYYQIAINPAGSVAEADRRMGVNTNWSSGAKVATYIGEDYWSIEICIPAAGESAASLDPLHGVAGKRPTSTYPWYMNVCRTRLRESGKELTAFSPTGKTDFHDTFKFGVLWVP